MNVALIAGSWVDSGLSVVTEADMGGNEHSTAKSDENELFEALDEIESLNCRLKKQQNETQLAHAEIERLKAELVQQTELTENANAQVDRLKKDLLAQAE